MTSINYGPEISILIVDDDRICLSIVSTILQKMNHSVVAMKNPVDALDAIRMKEKSFDLIITDVHMPEMSGLELLKHVAKEFKLPVVLMSADIDQDIMRQALNDGAMFYLLKPISSEKLARIWQFANLPEDENPTNNPVTLIHPPPLITSATDSLRVQDQFGMMNVNNSNMNVNAVAPLALDKGKQIESAPPLIFSTHATLKKPKKDATGLKGASVSKRPKLVWTTSLHNVFLEAVKSIGLKKAVPKKILEVMKVPGLKRENVASHLQKYRIFMKKIEETTGSMDFGLPNNWNERPFRSSFVFNEITYLSHKFQRQCQEIVARSQGADRELVGATNNSATPIHNINNDCGNNNEMNYANNSTSLDHNATLHDNDFGWSQEMPDLSGIEEELRELGIEFSHQNTGGYDFDFGSNDVKEADQGGLFDVVDQEITGNDDIWFESYFAQEYGEGSNQKDDNIDSTKSI